MDIILVARLWHPQESRFSTASKLMKGCHNVSDLVLYPLLLYNVPHQS